MKNKLVLLLFATTLIVSCKDNDAVNRINLDNAKEVEQRIASTAYPSVKFNKTMHDFGDVPNNEAVFTEFELVNTGDSDLIILGAAASCGCTVPEYQKTPIKPGESSILKVRFQQGTPGVQQKTVTIKTNTKSGVDELVIKANVAPVKN